MSLGRHVHRSLPSPGAGRRALLRLMGRGIPDEDGAPGQRPRGRRNVQRAVAALALGATLAAVAGAFALLREPPGAVGLRNGRGAAATARAAGAPRSPASGTRAPRALAVQGRSAAPTGRPSESRGPVDGPPAGSAAAAAPLTLARPVPGPVLLAYGWSLSPTFGDWRFHPGIDLAAPIGTPVRAAAAGTVAAVTHDRQWGWRLDERLPGGATVRYAALESVAVAAGAALSAGQVVGHVGPSPLQEAGLAPHVYVQVSRSGGTLDPATLWG